MTTKPDHVCYRCQAALGPDDGAMCDKCREKDSKGRKKQRKLHAAAGQCTNCTRSARKKPDGSFGKLCEICTASNSAAKKQGVVQQKIEIVQHYGKKCSARGCPQSDPALLEVCTPSGEQGSSIPDLGNDKFYRRLARDGYPAGYVVMCPTCMKKAKLAAKAN